MNSTIQIFLLCPIPNSQKPITEYIELQENFLGNWTILSNKKYNLRVFLLFFFFFLIKNSQSLFSFSNILVTLFFHLVFLFPLFRWLTINRLFQNSRLFYEEASWYDGQIWEKPLILIKNEKLLSRQKIEPIIQRILHTYYFFFFISLI